MQRRFPRRQDGRPTALLRSVHAVSRIAEARHDIALLVEMAVDRGGEDRLRPDGAPWEVANTSGRLRRQEKRIVPRTASLSFSMPRSRNCRCEHLGSTTMTRRSLMLSGALKKYSPPAESRDPGRRRYAQRAPRLPVRACPRAGRAGAQDGSEDELLPSSTGRRFHERRLDPFGRQLQIARDLIAEQRRDFLEQPRKPAATFPSCA